MTSTRWLAACVLALMGACGGGMDAPVDGAGGDGAIIEGSGGTGGGIAAAGSGGTIGGTGGQVAAGTGGAVQVHGTGGAPVGGTGGASSGTGGATVNYAPCSTYGASVVTWGQISTAETATKSLWGYVGSHRCFECSPFPVSAPTCELDQDRSGLCVQSKADCTIWVEGSSGMAP